MSFSQDTILKAMSTAEKRPDQAKIIKAQYQFIRNIDTQELSGSKMSVSFLSGQSWIDFFGSPASFSFSEKPQKSNAGTFFKQELRLSNPGDSNEFIINEVALIDMDLILRIEYSDGRAKIIGSRATPVNYDADLNSNADQTTYQVIFSSESIHRSRFEA